MSKDKSGASEIEKTIIKAFEKIKSSSEELKRDLESIKVENASEVPTGEGKHCYLVQMSAANAKDLKKVHNVLVKQFEENFSTPVVIIPYKKRINGKLYRRYVGTKVPRERTLAAVFDAYLDDLIYPATIIGKRIRYPKGSVRNFKIMVDPLDKDTINYKTPAITACYKALTNRNLEIQF